jgi:cysteine-rich repeat protein
MFLLLRLPYQELFLAFALILFSYLLFSEPVLVSAQTSDIATTTIRVSICGNSLVDSGEECDVPGETGSYSTTIVGRQCSLVCEYGPYCGDGILQTLYSEECDDGNNVSGDFCSETCTIEPAGSGGGGSSGGGGRSSGGGEEDLGDTQVSVVGQTFPRATVNIILDSDSVGSVRADNNGRFEFATNASPGTVSMGFWATDSSNVRSVTFNTTFDVTQGAITNVAGIFIPPTISVNDAAVNVGDSVIFKGQAIPNATIQVQIGSALRTQTTTSDASGNWTLTYSTAGLTANEYAVKARSVIGASSVTSESGFSTTLQLAVGVNGQPGTPSDLNTDGLINLIDFSILIFWWQTDGGNSDPAADINGNGRVSIEDFSILLFNWTG